MSVPFEITTPLSPGNFTLRLKLGYQEENSEFGDEICITIISKLDNIYSLDKIQTKESVIEKLVKSNEFEIKTPLVVEDKKISRLSWAFYEKPRPDDNQSWITVNEEEVPIEENDDKEFDTVIKEIIRYENPFEVLMRNN